MLQHKLKNIHDKHNTYNADDGRKSNEETWYTIYKFKDDPKRLNEFQPCCCQYEIDPNTTLSFIPCCIIKDTNGKKAKSLSGTKFTTYTFEGTYDIKEKGSDLPDNKLNELLTEEFGISMKSVIPFTAIMSKNLQLTIYCNKLIGLIKIASN